MGKMIRYKKVYNKFYVYEVTQEWDKTLKKQYQKSKYLGVANENGGDYTKPGKKQKFIIEKSILDFGDSYVINEISKDIGLNNIIDSSFSNLDSIMSLICFQITEGLAMYNCEDWLIGNIAQKLFPTSKVNSKNISLLLKILGRQDLHNKFFKSYIDKFFFNNQNILIDSTSLTSAINNPINAFGYSDGNIEQNVTCLMLVDKETKLPIYFRIVGGDIVDISTLKTTITEIKKLGLKTNTAIFDAGFCSKENLRFICNESINFITRLPKSHKAFSILIKESGKIDKAINAISYNKRVVFIKSIKTQLYDNDIYAHIIFDPSKNNSDTKIIFKDKLEDDLTETDINNLDEAMEKAGFFILLSREEILSKDILPSYYERQAIEQIFGFAKHNNNILPLRVHTEETLRGYLMLSFLSLIIFINIRQRVQMPMDKVLLSLRNIKAKIFDDSIIVQEINRKTKIILKKLNITMPVV